MITSLALAAALMFHPTAYPTTQTVQWLEAAGSGASASTAFGDAPRLI
jgi:hypothetical protein